MPWLKCRITADARDAETLETRLTALGASCVTLMDAGDEPILEPPPGSTPLWSRLVLTALFENHHDPLGIIASLSEDPGIEPARCHFETLADQQWERAWMADFKPMRFGKRLWIVPSWCEPPEPGAVNLRLDPGLAFGSGTHETTALCLEWLDGECLDGASLLDYGCGSGVLALGGLLLGAARATACDIDPQALAATRENAQRNSLAAQLNCASPDTLPATASFDVLVANILAQPLAALAGTLAAHCRPGARMALSGILATQADTLLNCYLPWFDLDPVSHRGDWVRISGTRRA